MNFNYFIEQIVHAQLSVEDIGNCAIEGNNDLGESFYLIVETTLGSTRIFEFGPIMQDIKMLPKSVKCTFDRIIYSEPKIGKRIEQFLNNRCSGITSAMIVDKDYALSQCRDIAAYMKTEE